MKGFDASCHLSLQDVSVVQSPCISTIVIRIKCSKTDQFGNGVHIYLRRTGASLCPVSALLDYLSVRGLTDGPLFLFSDGQPLSRVSLVSKVRSALSSLGMNVNQFSGHSFRIGGALTVLHAGVSDVKIKMLGRWESSAY